MDVISECAINNEALLNTQYQFTVSKKRKLKTIYLDFLPTDFFHISGLQYLIDLDIDKRREKTIQLAKDGIISDNLLKTSIYFISSILDGRDVKSRIEELRYLSLFLDTDNFISIFTLKDLSTRIRADYVIKSRLAHSSVDVFIFLRKREESDHYGIVFFFKKNYNDYSGEKLYWMKKSKVVNGVEEVLFLHPHYSG